MPLPDPADHTPDCTAVESGKPARLLVAFDPAENGTVLIHVWESCQSCFATIDYASSREPWRRFHRSWRASLAIWVATWEHRHNLGGRLT